MNSDRLLKTISAGLAQKPQGSLLYFNSKIFKNKVSASPIVTCICPLQEVWK